MLRSRRAPAVCTSARTACHCPKKRLVKAQALSQEFLIGVSCHSLDAARSAASGGAAYLFFCPIFATPSKAAFVAPQVLERLAEDRRVVSIPLLAFGGHTFGSDPR